MKEHDKLHGFTVTRVREIAEIEGSLVEMVHDKTGARLVWADNGEENKLFSVGFRTLPEDSTGVFHILEHSVLCGSDKFPVREPFVELLKTSMNTFLNAMTYSDKTLYPVSSRIKQDYLNLMEVYLDAVFRPAILTNPNIFYQEGWHIDTGGDAPAYKGVVFNEMKGAMSDVDQLAERTMGKMLFPDSCYGYNSGGDPDAIVDLTYEKFLETYRKFYHPSNSYFYLDGDIPVDETLEKIASYLDSFDKLDDLPEIAVQHPVTSRRSMPFDAGEGENKGVVTCGRIIGSWEHRDEMLALSIVLEQLADSNESPLKRAVLSTGLAEDMEVYVSDGIAQPYLMMIFRGVSDAEADADRLLDAACEAVNKAAADGISARDLEASINQLDFRFRQYPEPQGLYRANAAFSSWLYDGDPALYLTTGEAIANLREMAAKDGFSGLAKELLGDRDAYSVLTLLPDPEYGEKEARAEAEYVAAAVDSMGEAERESLEKLNSELLAWQQTPDSDEAIAKIPRLALSDIDPMPELFPTEIKKAGGNEVLFHKVASNGIVYINAYFPVTGLSLEELPAAALITEFYKDLPTRNYDVLALQNELRMHVGSMSFGLDILASDADTKECTPCIRARASVLEDKLGKAEELMTEILLRTKFDDRALMRELIKQIDEEGKRAAVSSGHRLALYEARSHWSARDAAAEAANGYSFLQYMHKMSAASDEELDSFIAFAKSSIAECINKDNLILSETASEYADISGLVSMLPGGRDQPQRAHYEAGLPANMGIQIPAAVSFSVLACDMTSAGLKMSGSMSVAANIIGLAHLWNAIRVQGGAYGASMQAGRSGNLFCYTYRDPSPSRSLGILRNLPDFLEEFASAEDADIDGFIISTISSTEPLLSPAAKGRAADDFMLSGFTDDDRIRFRREMLETKPADLLAQKEALRLMAESGCTCVVGPKSALAECEGLELFDL